MQTHTVTAVVKTLNRPSSLRKCLESWHARHPELEFIVGDDSPKPYVVDVVRSCSVPARPLVLPHDSGNSACRNVMEEMVQTEFILAIDDDMFPSEETDIDLMVRMSRDHGVDHNAGLVIRPNRKSNGWVANFREIGTVLIAEPVPARAPFTRADAVTQFALRRRERLEDDGRGTYPSNIKTYEHLCHMIEMWRRGWVCGVTPTSRCFDSQSRPEKYDYYRSGRIGDYRDLVARYYGYSHVIAPGGHVSVCLDNWKARYKEMI